MRISLFSQSLFALPLEEAIDATAQAGYDAIELACCAPHLTVERALREAERIARRIERVGLRVSALSGFNSFTDALTRREQISAAATFIRLAPAFDTHVVKLTPGPPGSAQAVAAHWRSLQDALVELVPLARQAGVRLAFETHMRQLTDTLASSKRLLDMAPADVVGLTVDYSNLAFAGESPERVVTELLDRTYNTHLKNGFIDAQGGWRFGALDQGLTDYALVLGLLLGRYEGYLTIECLGPESQTQPAEAAARDLAILRRYLREVASNAQGGEG